VLELTQVAICMFFSGVEPLLSGSSVWRVEHRCLGVLLVCKVVSAVVGVA
jgi:hypothetical protein